MAGETPPLDRVAAYLEHPPTHGVTLFTHRSAPNGYKVAVVLSELGIEYHLFEIDLERHEERLPGYHELNPNARLPAIVDHDNDNFALWESGAIVEYLCRRPPTSQMGAELASQLLGGTDCRQQAEVSAWLYFQASGHAPIIGHALQFRYLDVHAVAARFLAEVRRVVAVVEVYLAEKREQMLSVMQSTDTALDQPVYLVGNSLTLADLSFVPWNRVLAGLGVQLERDYPEVHRWTRAIMARPRVREALRRKPAGDARAAHPAEKKEVGR